METKPITKEFFELTLTMNWDMEEVNRGLSLEKCRNYLANFDGDNKIFHTFLLEQTKYLSFNGFKKILTAGAEGMLNIIGDIPFHLLIDDSKIGSECWIIALLWPMLRTKNVIDIRLSSQNLT